MFSLELGMGSCSGYLAFFSRLLASADFWHPRVLVKAELVGILPGV